MPPVNNAAPCVRPRGTAGWGGLRDPINYDVSLLPAGRYRKKGRIFETLQVVRR